MHARFADSEPASPDSVDGIETESLEARIEAFKQNPQNMAALREALDDVLLRAETEANRRAVESQKSQQVDHTYLIFVFELTELTCNFPCRARKNDRVSIRSVVQYISLLSYLDSVLLFPFEHFSANPCQVLAAE